MLDMSEPQTSSACPTAAVSTVGTLEAGWSSWTWQLVPIVTFEEFNLALANYSQPAMFDLLSHSALGCFGDGISHAKCMQNAQEWGMSCDYHANYKQSEIIVIMHWVVHRSDSQLTTQETRSVSVQIRKLVFIYRHILGVPIKVPIYIYKPMLISWYLRTQCWFAGTFQALRFDEVCSEVVFLYIC